jgi:hypothetical protein
LPLDLPDNELTAQLTGEVRADNTRQLLVQLLQPPAAMPAARAAPLLIVLDDAHWFDSASWALTRLVVARIRPLLLVLATRPLVEPLPEDYRRLRQDPATEYLRLEPLSPHDTLALVCDRLGVRHLPEPVAALIQERAQGNPFFSEELAYALRDAGLIRITDGTCTIAPDAGALSAMSFPDTMQGVVAARIDRLPPGPELTLKVASVVGRLFAFRLLRDIHPIEADRRVLRGFLDDLQRHDFTVLDTPEPDLAYLFRHVVIQEVAYGLLLSAQRRQLHRAVGEWYEQTQAEDLSSLYPLLAYHWGRAEEPTGRWRTWSWRVNRPCASAPTKRPSISSPTPWPGQEQSSPPPMLCNRPGGTASSLTPTRGSADCPRAASTPNGRWRCWAGRCQRRGCGCWAIWPGRRCNRASAEPGQRDSSAWPQPVAAPRWRRPERTSGSRCSTTSPAPELRVSVPCSMRSTWPSGLGRRRSWRAPTAR